MNKAIITFSFDDARADSYRAIKLALEYGIKSTLNVTTGYVDGRNNSNENPTCLPAMSKTNVTELYGLGIEIACHGDTHDNRLSSIINGKNKLVEWLQLEDKDSLGFASPHSMIDMTPSMIEELKNNNIVYLRVGPFITPLSKVKRFARKIASITKSSNLFIDFYHAVLKNPIIDDYIIRSIPIMRQNNLSQLKAIVDRAIANNSWVIFMFHSVLNKNEDGYYENFSWPLDDYMELCKYIQAKNEKVDCLTTMDAFHKIQSI